MATQSAQHVPSDRGEVQWEAERIHTHRDVAGTKQWLIEWSPTIVPLSEYEQMCVDTIDGQPIETMMRETAEIVVDGRAIVHVLWKNSWVEDTEALGMAHLIKAWWEWFARDCVNGLTSYEGDLVVVVEGEAKWISRIAEVIAIDGLTTYWKASLLERQIGY
ncbi:hypothetical protein B0A54_17809 [Friedmanniomyces endolithicus]|uniref:Uncharacterized protein n=1 Tax=Friedmanniomyces endolithicus TaxID=329885 RepID=A0A4V5N3K4_9PEZI|nr:hypothetical protein LTS09_017147 [Friedmanniomyces endolithicus]TKA23999.1 hypothetical protein B0A54_17809 [Friedmanniomyces endolithicus]